MSQFLKLEGASSFEHWVRHRSIPSMSTNTGAATIAFQDWHKFKEAFAPEIVQRAIVETEAAGISVSHVVDPFGGSGTTALAAQFLGKRSTSIEVNPFLADVIEAKLSSYDYDEVGDAYLRSLRGVSDSQGSHTLSGAPKTFLEPGDRGNFIFTRDVAATLMGLLNSIEACGASADVRRLLKVLLVSISLSVSNVVVSGKGRRYRRNWQDRPHDGGNVIDAFRTKVEAAMYDIRRFGGRARCEFSLLRGDARVRSKEVESFEVAVFSPPYPNSFDYTDVYNVELWVGGYLRNSDDNIALRKKTLRSHVQIKREFSSERPLTATLSNTVQRLEGERQALWNRHIPDMIAAYFDDLQIIIENLLHHLQPKGRLYMVVGDSSYAGIPVPVAKILCEMCVGLGMTLHGSEPFRSMRLSPQQGGREELPETLITLSRN